jgi:hypothetical protein
MTLALGKQFAEIEPVQFLRARSRASEAPAPQKKTTLPYLGQQAFRPKHQDHVG